MPHWFAPHVEFRFPVYGRVCYEGVEVELRQAIEPWYVLGEEPGAGGTARYVDSSVERLQVRVKGLVPERHTVTCNRFQLPLQPTGTAGRVRVRRPVPRVAAAPLPASDHSGAHAARLRRRGPARRGARSAGARIMSAIRAGGTTRPFR